MFFLLFISIMARRYDYETTKKIYTKMHENRRKLAYFSSRIAMVDRTYHDGFNEVANVVKVK